MRPSTFALKRRLAATAMCLLVGFSASAADKDLKKPDETPIATTAFITRIDLKNKLFKIKRSENEGASVQSFGPRADGPTLSIDIGQSRRRRSGIGFPGGVSIELPGKVGKQPPIKTGGDTSNSGETYTVVFSDATIFKGDGGESVKPDDFKIGDYISIHGMLSGSILKATRIAIWPRY